MSEARFIPDLNSRVHTLSLPFLRESSAFFIVSMLGVDALPSMSAEVERELEDGDALG